MIEQHQPSSRPHSRRPAWRRVAALLQVASLALVVGCGAGGLDTGATGNPGGGSGGGGSGNPGSGGGAGSGGTGNPLDVVLDFSVENRSNTARTETVRASVPFPRGGYASLDNLVVSGEATAWLPLQYWSDGTVKIAQAQFTTVLEAGQTKAYRVARDEQALTGTFARNPWVAQFAPSLELGAEVRDTFSVAYRGFAAGNGEILQETPLVQVRRHRTYHTTATGGIGRDYLSSTFYVTEYRDMPFVTVDWILGNDYLGADSVPQGNSDPNLRPLGSVDVKSAMFLCKGASAIMPYRATQEGIGQPYSVGSGYMGAVVMQDTYLSDAQTRRYRFLLRFEPQGAAQGDLDRWRDTATSINNEPLLPLATQRTWEETAAAGLVGGPMAGPGDSGTRAMQEYFSWAGANHFGTWGNRADPLSTHTTGTPRNHPLSPELAHAIQGQFPRLLVTLEQKAWAQAMRPFHLYGLQVGAEQNILLWNGLPHAVSGEKLGRAALASSDPYVAYRTATVGRPVAHGWIAYDTEHWSNDLLFDYWTLSGDAWAKEELRLLGQTLKAVMRLRTYATANMQAARAEGWCMQGFAQSFLATRDAGLREYAMRRAAEVVDVQRNKAHASKAIKFQTNYPSTNFPMNHEYYMPWQHGAVLFGYLGAYVTFEDPLMMEIAEDVVDAVQYAWVANYQHPTLGYVANGLRYYVPISHNGTPIPANHWDATAGIGAQMGSSPLGGVHSFLVTGLHVLAALTPDASVRQRAELYGGMLLGTLDDSARWDKWKYCLPRRYQP